MGKRCVSGCKGLSQEICTKAPRCTYLNGKKTYCRLSHPFKMNPPSCKISRRMNKKNKFDVAKERIKQFFYKRKPEVIPTKQATPLASSSQGVPEMKVSSPDSLSDELSSLMNQVPKTRRFHAKKRNSRAKTQTRAQMMYRGL